MSLFEREGDQFEIRLPDQFRELLVNLATQLRELLVSGEEDGLERLFPPGYANDEERAEEYRLLTHDELLEKRLAAIEVLEHTATETRVDEDQLTAWMKAINDVRLVLGTRLDVTEDSEEVDPMDPRAPALELYRDLGYVVGDIVHALAGW